MLIANYSFRSLQTISFYIQRAMLQYIPLVLAPYLCFLYIQGGPKKVSHHQFFKKSH